MRYVVVALVVLVFVLGAVFSQVAQPVQAEEICFGDVPGVTNCLAEPFASYWRDNGALPVFGYPLTAATEEQPAGSNAPLVVQWTERTRLEQHPENSAPYQTLIGRMGAERLAQLGRDPAQEPGEAGPNPDCLWFAETQHNVCDQAAGQGFRSYWTQNGLNLPGVDSYTQSLQLFGLPLTAAQPEPSSNGELVLTQWFERARFEWHPDNPEASRVLLGRLGAEVRDNSTPVAQQSVQPTVALLGVGVEINRGFVAPTYGRIAEANVDWVRYNGIVWADVEPQPGQRDWGTIADVETDMAAIANQGATTTMIVRGAPSWARQVPESQCGPIKPEALDQFADFMGEAVRRYSQPPYNVKYWELGNEPDAGYSVVPSGDPFGCWGNADDPYYGGGAYAEMLKRVYPAIKAADPNAQVVIGGLLLDCDPTIATAEQPCAAGKFFEGVLRNGGAAAFDILAYHAYTYWGPVDLDWDLLHPKWDHRGGIFLGKLAFLQETMAAYGVSKPVVMNEGGLLCYRSSPDCAPEGFHEAQANYMVRLLARTEANDLLGSSWYTLNGPGWQEGGLLDPEQNPRPAYQTLQFVSSLLAGATHIDSQATDGLESHMFRKGDTTYVMYWTNDGTQVTVDLPAGTRAIYDAAGQSSAPSGAQLTVGFQPVIVEAGP